MPSSSARRPWVMFWRRRSDRTLAPRRVFSGILAMLLVGCVGVGEGAACPLAIAAPDVYIIYNLKQLSRIVLYICNTLNLFLYLTRIPSVKKNVPVTTRSVDAHDDRACPLSFLRLVRDRFDP